MQLLSFYRQKNKRQTLETFSNWISFLFFLKLFCGTKQLQRHADCWFFCVATHCHLKCLCFFFWLGRFVFLFFFILDCFFQKKKKITGSSINYVVGRGYPPTVTTTVKICGRVLFNVTWVPPRYVVVPWSIRWGGTPTDYLVYGRSLRFWKEKKRAPWNIDCLCCGGKWVL